MTIIPAKYKCDICGKVYTIQKEAEKCESQEKIEPILKVGDVITVCDCEDTPILTNRREEFYLIEEAYHDCIKQFGWYSAEERYGSKYQMAKMLHPLLNMYYNKRVYWKLERITYYNPHMPTYRFVIEDGTENGSSWYMCGGKNGEVYVDYPSLTHEQLLQQLKHYNPDIKIG